MKEIEKTGHTTCRSPFLRAMICLVLQKIGVNFKTTVVGRAHSPGHFRYIDRWTYHGKHARPVLIMQYIRSGKIQEHTLLARYQYGLDNEFLMSEGWTREELKSLFNKATTFKAGASMVGWALFNVKHTLFDGLEYIKPIKRIDVI